MIATDICGRLSSPFFLNPCNPRNPGFYLFWLPVCCPMAPEDTSIADDWYHKSFGALYPVIYAHRTVEAAEPEVVFAAQQLDLRKTDRVLDLCCGNGRHMVHLIQLAGHVVGLDYSPDLLALAREAVGSGARLVRADMREAPFDAAFDVVVNFFTSFGYFPSNDENLGAVREVARVLKRGGRFLVDYLNPPFVEKMLVPESLREYKEYTISEKRWIDRKRRRVNKSIMVSKNGKPVAQYAESVRLYTQAELLELMARGGLEAACVFGDYGGAAFGEEQPRMIVVGHKV